MRLASSEDLQVQLLRQLIGYGLAVSVFITLLMSSEFLALELDINPLHVVAIAMLFAVILLLHFLFVRSRLSTAQVYIEEQPLHLTFWHNEKIIEQYEERLVESMQKKKVFLNPKLTLDALAEETGISKAHISEYLRVYKKSNFYEWVASYRITYAIALLDCEFQPLKMEALAKESGFLSKTSFNKHFKTQVGISPSNYRSSIESR
ncbi:helix-turn-helix domain-containing protein [Sphingobacterium sp. LRF_L2]|uniref:helix-turn-helix domain-containing protein n=1 Tax=Sphingobacterium sp. LRF_L2 TaxID=3369421 RepID=UPI003F643D6D